jgi:hypothetical protein
MQRRATRTHSVASIRNSAAKNKMSMFIESTTFLSVRFNHGNDRARPIDVFEEL